MKQLTDFLASRQQYISSCTATIGFDGFIDTVVQLVQQKASDGAPAIHFESMESWGNFILSKKNSNCSVELTKRSTKAGGNMPNMASALAKLGIAVNCIGAMGYPSIDPLFRLPDHCRLFSFAAPGLCQAIEFEKGKMMLASMEDLNSADWHLLTQRIPVSQLIELVDKAQLLAMLNWGELIAATGHWKGLLQDVLPFCKSLSNRLIFVDLSDCSGRSKQELLEALHLLNAFTPYGKVMISMNQHECHTVYNSLFEKELPPEDILTRGQMIFQHLQPQTLIIHSREKAMAFRSSEFAESKSFPINKPQLLTGAGDNFNAGFCFSQLLDCSLQDSLLIAHLVAAHYIQHASGAGWNDIMDSLNNIQLQHANQHL